MGLQREIRAGMKYRLVMTALPLIAAAILTGCVAKTGEDDPDAGEFEEDVTSLDPQTLIATAKKKFGMLPDVMTSSKRPMSDAKVTLGRQLYFDKRLSKNHDLSCNTCHDLAQYGVD